MLNLTVIWNYWVHFFFFFLLCLWAISTIIGYLWPNYWVLLAIRYNIPTNTHEPTKTFFLPFHFLICYWIKFCAFVLEMKLYSKYTNKSQWKSTNENNENRKYLMEFIEVIIVINFSWILQWTAFSRFCSSYVLNLFNNFMMILVSNRLFSMRWSLQYSWKINNYYDLNEFH